MNNDTYKIFYFNGRLSRARRVVENAFGILSSRFRVFQTPIDIKIVETIDRIIISCCILHNLMLKEKAIENLEQEEGENNLCQWLLPIINNNRLPQNRRRRDRNTASAIRDFLCDILFAERENEISDDEDD